MTNYTDADVQQYAELTAADPAIVRNLLHMLDTDRRLLPRTSPRQPCCGKQALFGHEWNCPTCRITHTRAG